VCAPPGQGGALRGGAEHARAVRGERAKVGRFDLRVQPVRLAAGHLQQAVDQPLQPLCRAPGRLQSLPVSGADDDVRVVEYLLDRTEDERQRGPQFVTDVLEEPGLRQVEVGQGFPRGAVPPRTRARQ